MRAISPAGLPDLSALTAAYRKATTEWEASRDAWQAGIVKAIDVHGMTVPVVAELVGVTPSRIQAIIARQYGLEQPAAAA